MCREILACCPAGKFHPIGKNFARIFCVRIISDYCQNICRFFTCDFFLLLFLLFKVYFLVNLVAVYRHYWTFLFSFSNEKSSPQKFAMSLGRLFVHTVNENYYFSIQFFSVPLKPVWYTCNLSMFFFLEFNSSRRSSIGSYWVIEQRVKEYYDFILIKKYFSVIELSIIFYSNPLFLLLFNIFNYFLTIK